jgi:hypothetical protein
MSAVLAFGILLLGVGLGALLFWLLQSCLREQLHQELEGLLDQALFERLRRQGRFNSS